MMDWIATRLPPGRLRRMVRRVQYANWEGILPLLVLMALCGLLVAACGHVEPKGTCWANNTGDRLEKPWLEIEDYGCSGHLVYPLG